MTVREPVVCCYESRRAEEMRALIERQNAQVIVAPSMKEVPLEENQSGLDAIRQVLAGRVDSIVLLTGVGTEAMLDLAATAGLRDELLTAMNSIPLLVRGPKPAAVLHRLGLKFLVKAAEPNTSRELLDAIDQADLSLQGKVVAVQEYGVANPDLYDALKERGANVLPISVYSW
ncbi:MAG: uroporphyrinogen-III synthase, partial [Planctomycetaceae bacterium]|nr:uroporphyrinogen-III synthase [Planctomycetaceae bacterium]